MRFEITGIMAPMASTVTGSWAAWAFAAGLAGCGAAAPAPASGGPADADPVGRSPTAERRPAAEPSAVAQPTSAVSPPAAPRPPEPVDRTKPGRLEAGDAQLEADASYYDEHSFDAGHGWTIVVTMESSELDTYLHLLGPDGTTLLQNDDRAAGDTNSELRLSAPEAGTYTVLANSLNRGETGAYTLVIRATPP